MIVKRVLVVVLIAICCYAKGQNANEDFSKLFSLAGVWKMETSKGILYENWKKINDSTLKGSSYKVAGKDTIQLEEVELVKRRDKIQYIPVARGQNNNQPVVFTLKATGSADYVFENAEHDFPQRIVYKLPENNLLKAWIEGTINGQFKKMEYNYTKAL